MYDKQTLIELVRQRALKFGDFTLASGKQANYYLDGKQVTLDSFGAKLVAEGILDLLADNLPLPDAVGGMSIGADPITAAVITMAGVRGQAMTGFLVRKEPKGHGTNRYVEGPVTAGQRVVIVEDVVTTGGSSLEAIARVEEFGLKVSRVVTIIDRLEGGPKGVRVPRLSAVQLADDPRLRDRAARLILGRILQPIFRKAVASAFVAAIHYGVSWLSGCQRMGARFAARSRLVRWFLGLLPLGR